jgi:hypothetical protein
MPTSREKLTARVRNKQALELRSKARDAAKADEPPIDPDLREIYDRGRASAFAEAGAAHKHTEETAEAARLYARQNRVRREILGEIRNAVSKPLPRVVEATVLVRHCSTAVFIAELRRRGKL